MRRGLGLIKKAEGLKLKAYLCPAGIPTIGYGDTENVKMGMTITKDEAEDRLMHSYDKFEAGVKSLVKVPLTANQLGALVSFAYNLGLGALKKSGLLAKLNVKNYEAAAEEFSKWIYGGGKVLPGLVTRRAEEKKLFLTPDDQWN